MGSKECLKDRDRWKYIRDGWKDGQGWEGEAWGMNRVEGFTGVGRRGLGMERVGK